MKKICMLTLLLTTIVILPVIGQAETTEISISCPSDFILIIPADQIITNRRAEIGETSIYGTIEPGKSIHLSTVLIAFEHEAGIDTIPFILTSNGSLWLEDYWAEEEMIQGNEKKVPLEVEIAEEDWKRAKSGSYQAAIIYTAQIQ